MSRPHPVLRSVVLAIVILAVIGTNPGVGAQAATESAMPCPPLATPTATATATPTTTTTPTPTTSPTPAVTLATIPPPKVRCFEGTLALRNIITLHIPGLNEYLAKTGKSANTLVLFLNGKPLPGLYPTGRELDDPRENTLSFRLEHSATTRDSWRELLRGPLTVTVPDVAVSVGFEDGQAFPTDARADLPIFPSIWWSIGAAVLFIVLIIAFFALAIGTNILRDTGGPPTAEAVQRSSTSLGTRLRSTSGLDKPYSLARTQFAFWFFVILGSYGFLLLVTGDRDPFTSTALGLLGISTGAGLISATIDAMKQNTAASNPETKGKVQKLTEERDALAKSLRDIADRKNKVLATQAQQPINEQFRAIWKADVQKRLAAAEQWAKKAQKALNDADAEARRAANAAAVNPTPQTNELADLAESVRASAFAVAQEAARKEAALRIEAQTLTLPTATPTQPQLDAVLDSLNSEEQRINAAYDATVKELNALDPSGQPLKSEGFLLDILTDASGVVLHRFQVVIWTLVLGGVFLWSVWSELAMPEFSGGMLALLTISGGAYLGFKVPEKQS